MSRVDLACLPICEITNFEFSCTVRILPVCEITNFELSCAVWILPVCEITNLELPCATSILPVYEIPKFELSCAVCILPDERFSVNATLSVWISAWSLFCESNHTLCMSFASGPVCANM